MEGKMDEDEDEDEDREEKKSGRAWEWMDGKRNPLTPSHPVLVALFFAPLAVNAITYLGNHT